MSDDWSPSEGALRWTAQEAPGFPVETELPKFRDSHIGRGTKWRDYDRAWRNWVRRWLDDQQRKPPGRRGPYRNDGHHDGSNAASWDNFEQGGTGRV